MISDLPPASSPPPPSSAADASAPGDDGAPPKIPDTIAVLPTRGVAVFPGVAAPLSIDRAASRRLLEESLPQGRVIGLFLQKDADRENPGIADLHPIGVAVSVLKLLRPNDSDVVIPVHALERIAIRSVESTSPYIRAQIEVVTAPPAQSSPEHDALVQQLRDSALALIALLPDVPPHAAMVMRTIEDPGMLADMIANSAITETPARQELISERDPIKRVRTVLTFISSRLEMARLQQKIQQDVASRFTDA